MKKNVQVKRYINIIGIRGIPGNHGGFETFAEQLSLYLTSKGWKVTVYCQEDNINQNYETYWNGIRRIHIGTKFSGPLGTIIFDLKTIFNVVKQKGFVLTLGYNTAIFSLIFKIFGKYNFINMDGIEWKRDKWGFLAKSWFWLNEKLGCLLADHLIADHPEIKKHLDRNFFKKPISVIPYGAENINKSDIEIIKDYDLKEREY